MSLPSLTEKDLLPYFYRTDLIRQAAEQLRKDLEQFGEEIIYSGDPAKAYDELFSQTRPFILKLVQRNYEKLLQLLYRIDVNEKLVAEIVNSGEDIASGLTRLILFRELQKVVIRNLYSK